MTTIAGLFANRNTAESAIYALRDAGFDMRQMGLVMREPTNSGDTSDSTRSTGSANARVAEDAVAGGVAGGALGAILGATGLLVVPGIGPVIAAGVLASAVVGGIAGWLTGMLVGLGIPHYQADAYQARVERGEVLVTVDADDREAQAREIMAHHGAEMASAGTAASAPASEQGVPASALESHLPRTAPITPRNKPDGPDSSAAPMPPSGVADTTNTTNTTTGSDTSGQAFAEPVPQPNPDAGAERVGDQENPPGEINRQT